MNDKLYMLLLGCKPDGRYTEQHDIFFGIGTSLRDLVPEILNFWPQANGKIHIDAWREVTRVDGYTIQVKQREKNDENKELPKLFFINLGGYKENDFEEYHYKCLSVAHNTAEAIRKAKDEVFWKHSISSHIDDKYGVDVDDIYEIEDILTVRTKEQFVIVIEKTEDIIPDELYPGYLKLSKLMHGST